MFKHIHYFKRDSKYVREMNVFVWSFSTESTLSRSFITVQFTKQYFFRRTIAETIYTKRKDDNKDTRHLPYHLNANTRNAAHERGS